MTFKLRPALVSLALVGVGVIAGGEAALAVQGHMLAARADLQAARAQLNMAIPDKAGNRVAALQSVDRAIAETNAGLAAGAR